MADLLLEGFLQANLEKGYTLPRNPHAHAGHHKQLFWMVVDPMHACHVMIMSRSVLPLQEISTFNKERRACPPCFHFAWTSSGTSRRPFAFLLQALRRVASKAPLVIAFPFGEKPILSFGACQHGCLLVNQHSLCGMRAPSLRLPGRTRVSALGRRRFTGRVLANHVFVHVVST